MKFAHVLVVMPKGGNHPYMHLERHGKDTTELMGLQATCGYQTLCFQNGPCNPKAILPMAIFWFELYPIPLFQVIKADNPDILLRKKGHDALLIHYLMGGRIASLAQRD
jgi:hypothetical protein